MRVVTLNLWGRRGDWAARRAVLQAGLRALRPDLVAFQETIANDDYDQAIDLLGPGYYVAHQQRRAADGQAATVASRWPFAAVHEVDLQVTPRTADFAATTLAAEVQAPDPIGPLLFVNHFPNWQLNYEHERTLQAVTAARFIEGYVSQRPLHVVMAGDLDADPDASSIRFWSGRQALEGVSVCYRDAWESAHAGEPGHTFSPDNPLVSHWDWPFRRIDYVFVRCGLHGGPTLAVDGCAVIFDAPVEGVQASDHYGVMADLVVPPGLRTP